MTPATTPATPRKSHFVWAALGLAVLAVGAFVGWMTYRHFAQARLLRDALAETDALDPHWRMEALEAHRAAVPAAENSAPVIRHVRALLPRPGSTLYGGQPDWLRDLKLEVALTDEQYRAVIDALEEAERAINPALELAKYPRGRHPITYAPDGISTLLPHIDDICYVHGRVLQYLALAHAHEGDGAAAERDCLAILNLGRSVGDEPFAVSQLTSRPSLFREAVRALERFLGQTTVPEPALAVLQRELAAEAAYDPWEQVVRGERALLFQVTEAVRTGLLKTSTLRRFSNRPTTVTGQVRDWLSDRYPVNIGSVQAQLLRLCNRLQATARLPWPERRAAAEALVAEQTAVPEPYGLFLPGLVKCLTPLQEGRARGRCMVAAVAAERYRLAHGTWPPSLAALVPTFVPQVPADLFDGQPLRYRRLADGVVIYSVGPDGTDYGGQFVRDFPLPTGIDIGVRLWEPDRRRQPPPPNTPPGN
jgi:hypothetical protein